MRVVVAAAAEVAEVAAGARAWALQNTKAHLSQHLHGAVSATTTLCAPLCATRAARSIHLSRTWRRRRIGHGHALGDDAKGPSVSDLNCGQGWWQQQRSSASGKTSGEHKEGKCRARHRAIILSDALTTSPLKAKPSTARTACLAHCQRTCVLQKPASICECKAAGKSIGGH